MYINNGDPHRITQLVLRAEKAAQAMYSNPDAETNAEYFAAAEKLERMASAASRSLQEQNTLRFQEDETLVANIEELEDKLGKIETALSLVENTTGAIQASADILLSLRKIFGIL